MYRCYNLVNCHQITWYKVFQLFPPELFFHLQTKQHDSTKNEHKLLMPVYQSHPLLLLNQNWLLHHLGKENLTCTSYSLIFTLLLYTIRCFYFFLKHWLWTKSFCPPSFSAFPLSFPLYWLISVGWLFASEFPEQYVKITSPHEIINI